MTRRELIEQLESGGSPDDVVVAGTTMTAWDVKNVMPEGARGHGHGQGEAQPVVLLVLGRNPVTVEAF